MSTACVYLDRRSTDARRIFAQLDVDLVDDPARANLLWLRRGFEQALPHLLEGQLVNHFVNEGALINKGRLTANLNAAVDIDFYPESYRLYDAAERDAFFARLESDNAPDPIWILKPAHLSRGIGIGILREFSASRRFTPSCARPGPPRPVSASTAPTLYSTPNSIPG